jgi:NAD(P)H-nitrite reductase large subunit
MNLQGLALSMLGAFVEGSEEIRYVPLLEGILRQVFLREGRITGGALVGDITGAGPLHHLMIQGQDSISEVRRLIKPSFRLMSPNLSERGTVRRRAKLIPGEEQYTC